MWILANKRDPEKRHVIVGEKKFIVGRIGCDIIIPDSSVSRTQAQLEVFHAETNVVKSFMLPTLSLMDISKFGTYVNGKCVKKSGVNPMHLKEGDEIKFGGTPESTYIVHYEPFIVTTSCIDKVPKKTLGKTICALGGHLVRDWRHNCELLVMPKINVTFKVVCALNNQRHIVTPDYFDHLHSHFIGQKDKPDPTNYLPEVIDQEVPPGVSFHPDERRQALLKGLKFYFLSAVQFNKTNLAVSTAGGQPILLEDGTEEDAETMCQSGTVVFAVNTGLLVKLSTSCQKFVRLVYNTLNRHKLRMISDPEVGWAILTCNIEQFCNPTSEITPSMYSAVATQMTQCDSTQATTMCEDGEPLDRSTDADISDSPPGEDKLPADESSCVRRSTDLNGFSENDTSPPEKATLVQKTYPQKERGLKEENPLKTVNMKTFQQENDLDARNSAKSRMLPSEDRNSGGDSDNDIVFKLPAEQKASHLSGDLFSTNADGSAEKKNSAQSRLSGDLFSSNISFSDKSEDNESAKHDKNEDNEIVRKVMSDISSSLVEEKTLSVFARQRNATQRNVTSKSKAIKYDSSDEEDAIVHKKPVKRKAMFSFDDDKEEDMAPHSKVGKKGLFESDEDSPKQKNGSIQSKLGKKGLFESDEDSPKQKNESIQSKMGKKGLFESDEDSPKQKNKSIQKEIPQKVSEKDAGKRKLTPLIDSNDDEDNSSRPKSGKKNIFESEQNSLCNGTSTGITDLKKSEKTNENVVCKTNSLQAVEKVKDKDNEQVLKTNDVFSVADSVEDTESEDQKPKVLSAPNGWLCKPTGGVQIKQEPSSSIIESNHHIQHHNSEHTGGIQDEKKPQVDEIPTDEQGNPLRNLVQIKVVNLLARPIGSKTDKNQSKSSSVASNNGLKNFKKFRKNNNSGSGSLPTIIGGRDLEVFLGNKHKNIEDLFASGLVEDNERRDDEKRARALFDWDSSQKAKKPTGKKTR